MFAALAAAGMLSSASAQPRPGDTPAPTEPEKPWYKGVSEADRQKARELFVEGAKLHKQALLVQAVDSYRRALSHWDHPGIHYNLCRALIKLDRPIEAYQSLLAALRYGEISLAADEYEQALVYKKLLRGRLVEVEVSCDEEGAEVTMDGEILFTGAGKKSRLALPGPHQITATKPGYIADHKRLRLLPGERREVTLKPTAPDGIATAEIVCNEAGAEVSLDSKPLFRCPNRTAKTLAPNVAHVFTVSKPGQITTQREIVLAPGQRSVIELRTSTVGTVETEWRWQQWKPWSVAGAGAATLVLGMTLRWRASENFAQYDGEIVGLCSPPQGCLDDEIPVELADQKSRAEWQNRIAFGSLVLGGAALATGLVLVIINQPRTYRVDSSADEGPAVAPLLTGDAIGVVAKGSF